MKKVLPESTFTQYKIPCPYCKWPWYFVENQLKHPKFVFVCDCGKAWKPVSDITPKNVEKVVKGKLVDDVIEIMIMQGWSKKEAKQKVSAVYDSSKSLETLLKDAIFNGFETKDT